MSDKTEIDLELLDEVVAALVREGTSDATLLAGRLIAAKVQGDIIPQVAGRGEQRIYDVTERDFGEVAELVFQQRKHGEPAILDLRWKASEDTLGDDVEYVALVIGHEPPPPPIPAPLQHKLDHGYFPAAAGTPDFNDKLTDLPEEPLEIDRTKARVEPQGKRSIMEMLYGSSRFGDSPHWPRED